jgi:hypothetical protein
MNRDYQFNQWLWILWQHFSHQFTMKWERPDCCKLTKYYLLDATSWGKRLVYWLSRISAGSGTDFTHFCSPHQLHNTRTLPDRNSNSSYIMMSGQNRQMSLPICSPLKLSHHKLAKITAFGRKKVIPPVRHYWKLSLNTIETISDVRHCECLWC